MDSVCLLTTSARVNDVNALARIIDEHLIAGHVLLAHHRRKSPLEFTEQITEPAVAITVRLHLPIFLPQHHQVYAGTLELARQQPGTISPSKRDFVNTLQDHVGMSNGYTGYI